MICVRFLNRAPKDAADEVEYFNGSPDTPMGGLRAKHGQREAYYVRLWQVGNEIGTPDYAAPEPRASNLEGTASSAHYAKIRAESRAPPCPDSSRSPDRVPPCAPELPSPESRVWTGQH